MNKLVWKLLRRHISIGQLTGFFLANLLGMTIVLMSVQFYSDVLPVFTSGDSFMKKDYIIATKRISALGGITGKDNTFSKDDIEAMKEQSFTRSVGAFTPSLFKVSAGVGMQEAGIHLSTEMFFESVPDEYVDVSLDKWHFDEGSHTIPIIIPRNYLNLYNFGFAQSRSLPKLSEGLISMIQMDIVLRGNEQTEQYKGNIVGFSNRLNTILVPQSFMDWANNSFAPGKEAKPSRLIVEVKNPTDTAINEYFSANGYETEGDNLDAGKNHLLPASRHRHCHGSRAVYQHTVILYPDVEHFLAVAKEYRETGKPSADRIQPHASGPSLPRSDDRVECRCPVPCHRWRNVDTHILYRKDSIFLSTVGRKFVASLSPDRLSLIPCRVAAEYSRHTEKDFRNMERREEGSLAHYLPQSIQAQKGNNNGSTNIITTPMIICNGSPTFM